MNTNAHALFALLTLAGCGGAAAATDASTTPDVAGGPPSIAGAWVSDCLPTDTGSMRLDFDLTATTWALDYETFGDGACGAPFITVHIAGPYEIGAASAAVAGAYEARFGFTEKTVTPHGDAAVGFLASLGAACGGEGTWASGTGRDVLASGCPMLGQYPGAMCPADYDLVSLEDGVLRFGARPADNDMCTAAHRPTALGASVHRP